MFLRSIASENDTRPPSLEKPSQESIHLSLPSAGEEEDDDGSEWDTDR